MPFSLFRYEHSRGFFHFFVMNTAGAFSVTCYMNTAWAFSSPVAYEHSRGLNPSPVIYEHSRGSNVAYLYNLYKSMAILLKAHICCRLQGKKKTMEYGGVV